MIDFNNIKGFDIVANLDGSYAFYANHLIKEMGTLSHVATAMVEKYGFNKQQVDMAVEDLAKTKCDRAHFGSAKYFMFCFDEPLPGSMQSA